MGDGFFDSDGAFESDAVVAVAVAGKSSSVVRDDDFFSGGCDDAIFAAMVLLLLLLLLLLGWSVQSKAKEFANDDRQSDADGIGGKRVDPGVLFVVPPFDHFFNRFGSHKAESRFRRSGRSAARLSNKTTKHYSPNSGGVRSRLNSFVCNSKHGCAGDYTVMERYYSMFSFTIVEFPQPRIPLLHNRFMADILKGESAGGSQAITDGVTRVKILK
jgi:hypothetical protein